MIDQMKVMGVDPLSEGMEVEEKYQVDTVIIMTVIMIRGEGWMEAEIIHVMMVVISQGLMR